MSRPTVCSSLVDDALDDPGDDVADDEDDEEPEQVRQEAEERVEALLKAVADVDGGQGGHGGSSLRRGKGDVGAGRWPASGRPPASGRVLARRAVVGVADAVAALGGLAVGVDAARPAPCGRSSETSRCSVIVSLSRRTRSLGTALLSTTTSSSWSTTSCSSSERSAPEVAASRLASVIGSRSMRTSSRSHRDGLWSRSRSRRTCAAARGPSRAAVVPTRSSSSERVIASSVSRTADVVADDRRAVVRSSDRRSCRPRAGPLSERDSL